MLSQIKSAPKERKIIVWDLEWYPRTYELRLVGVFDGIRYRSYRTIKEFLRAELTSENQGAWFYAHAGGLADMAFVLEELMKSPWHTVDARFSGSSAVTVSVTCEPHTWVFVDSLWTLKGSVDEIGKSIGLLKGTSGRSEVGKYEQFYANDKELQDYNEQDCKILYAALRRFEDELLELGGELKQTLASCGLTLFRRRFLTRDIEIPSRVNDVARSAYYASRVEVIRPVATQGAKYFDVNSSFPHAMTFPAPAELQRVSSRLPSREGAVFLADVELDASPIDIPPTPARFGSQVFFPHGSWRGWLTSVDVTELERHGGRIRKVHRVLEFDTFDDLRGYAETIYAMRKSATDEFTRYVLKLLMNSCYGKFAESREKERLVLNPMSTRCAHKPRCPHDSCMRMLVPGAWLVTEEIEIPHEHVFISAHITAIARRTLHGYLVDTDPYYCDTDSVVTDTDLGSSNELGKLKHEKDVVVEARFLAPKVYRFDGMLRAKGFSRLSESRFARLERRESISYERMARIRELYSAEDHRPRDVLVVKAMRQAARPKRAVLEHDPSRTRPWSVEELGEPWRGVSHDASCTSRNSAHVTLTGPQASLFE